MGVCAGSVLSAANRPQSTAPHCSDHASSVTKPMWNPCTVPAVGPRQPLTASGWPLGSGARRRAARYWLPTHALPTGQSCARVVPQSAPADGLLPVVRHRVPQHRRHPQIPCSAQHHRPPSPKWRPEKTAPARRIALQAPLCPVRSLARTWPAACVRQVGDGSTSGCRSGGPPQPHAAPAPAVPAPACPARKMSLAHPCPASRSSRRGAWRPGSDHRQTSAPTPRDDAGATSAWPKIRDPGHMAA